MLTRKFRQLRNWTTLTPLRALAALALAVALLASAGFATNSLISARHLCSTDVVHLDGQCIGVTDGAFTFANPQLGKVERAIYHENQLIKNQTHVTIALLLPLTDPDPNAQTEILHDVQGAYAAQYQANHDSNSLPPKIRLVLANPGVDSVHWRPVVRELASMTSAPDNLRVVFGISVSTVQTEAEVRQLTRIDRIPVVTGAPTADSFANTPQDTHKFPGLARVALTDSQETDAISKFAGVDNRYAIVVNDTRYGDTPDDYIESLYDSYRNRTPYADYPFSSPQDESTIGHVPNAFNDMVPHICNSDAKWIYFAGRQWQLRMFANQLAGACTTGRRFTIITGDAASHLVGDKALHASDFTAAGGITLDYPAIASPYRWTGSNSAATTGPQANFNYLHNILRTANIGPAGTLTDGLAMINFDAAYTGIQGIRNSVPPSGRLPGLRDVASAWPRMIVAGTSGTICLDNAGNPYDKQIDIMRYHSSGQPAFAKPAWSDGTALGATCNPPRNG